MFRAAAVILSLLWFPVSVSARIWIPARKPTKLKAREITKPRSCTTPNVSKRGDLTTKNMVLALYDRGNAYLAKEQFLQAIEDYNKATRLDPTHAYAFNNRETP